MVCLQRLNMLVKQIKMVLSDIQKILQVRVAEAEAWPAIVARDTVCHVDLYTFAFTCAPAPHCSQ